MKLLSIAIHPQLYQPVRLTIRTSRKSNVCMEKGQYTLTLHHHQHANATTNVGDNTTDYWSQIKSQINEERQQTDATTELTTRWIFDTSKAGISLKGTECVCLAHAMDRLGFWKGDYLIILCISVCLHTHTHPHARTQARNFVSQLRKNICGLTSIKSW